jgi:hypothetical protein
MLFYSYIGTQVIKLVISFLQFDLLVMFEGEAIGCSWRFMEKYCQFD